ncbi:MAG: HEAT repeat domain-containing protein, partial [Bradymonadaceae bacterium]
MTNHKLPLSAHFHPASGEETDLVTITPPVAGELELEYRAVSFTADEAMIPEWGERLLGGAPQYLGRLFFDGQPLTVEAEEALVTYFDEDGNDGDSLEEKVDSTGEINVTWLVELLTANTDFPVAELLAAEGKPTRSHPGFWKSNGQSGTPLDERCRWTLKLISEYDRPTFFGSETQIFSFDFEARTLSWQHYFAPTVYAPKDEEEEEEFYGEPIDPASVKKALNVKDTTKAGDRLRQLGWNSVSPALRRRFIPALTELLSATNAKLRFKALYFLDQVAYDAGDAKEALVALCSDDDVVIRRHAMSALGKVGNLSDEELK